MIRIVLCILIILIVCLKFVVGQVATSFGTGYYLNTLAGTGVYGYNGDGILATSSNLATPSGVAVNSLDEVFIADTGNHRIRKIVPCPPNSIQSGSVCQCNVGYFGYGQYCDMFQCNNILMNSSSVCSSHGQCIAPDQCTCNTGYNGTNCETYYCYDFLHNKDCSLREDNFTNIETQFTQTSTTILIASIVPSIVVFLIIVVVVIIVIIILVVRRRRKHYSSEEVHSENNIMTINTNPSLSYEMKPFSHSNLNSDIPLPLFHRVQIQ